MKGIMRVGAIARSMAKHGLGDIADRLFRTSSRGAQKTPGEPPAEAASPRTARRFRKVLEELGPSFIKLGQLLSTRADVLPEAYIEELKKLQDSVPPVSFEKIEKRLEKELKQPLAEIFKDFNHKTIAAASVAQVYSAELFSGEKVAVKVIRPGIQRKIRDDIRLMRYLAVKLEKVFNVARIIGALNIVTEFERTIFKELDMLIEAGNIEQFARNFKFTADIHIPKVYWEHTTHSVLVLEFIPGVKVDRVDEIREQGIDPKEIALIGLRSFSRQLMEFGYFHADPHPGNTIVMADGRVGLVDFGIMGYLDDEMKQQVACLFLGYAEHDYDLVMEALTGAGLVDEDSVDLKSFRMDLKEVSEPFYGRTLQTTTARDVHDQVMKLVLKYQIHLPRNLLLLLKTLIQNESLGKILGSDASLLEVMKPHAKKLLMEGYESQKLMQNLGRDIRLTGGYLRTAPKLVHDILRRTAQGKQRIELRHTGFSDIVRKSEKGLNRLTIGIIIAASTIAGALILNSSQKFVELSIPFVDGQTFDITALLGISGYTIATILGIWLVISIFRSGKL